jgi:2-polyprenyl-3-methyl-5-hydroxy-6-metoxy-1,4-benzoquinol methylase
MTSFSKRASDVRERMDDPAADERLLFATYRQFRTINRLFSRWGAVYARFIRPALRRDAETTLLDIGCGAGDIALDLHRRAERDGFRLRVLGIDPDPRAMRYLQGQRWPDGIAFRCATAAQLVECGEQFDIVTGNHMLHHLRDEEIPAFTGHALRLARRIAVFSDLERSAIAHALFSVYGALFLHGSFAAADGRTSIRRGFRDAELAGLLGAGWRVDRMFPYRLVAVADKVST